MSTPEERVEMFLDAQEQTDDWNRDMRHEERDAGVLWHPDDDRPDKRDLAEMAYWDRLSERHDREDNR